MEEHFTDHDVMAVNLKARTPAPGGLLLMQPAWQIAAVASYARQFEGAATHACAAKQNVSQGFVLQAPQMCQPAAKTAQRQNAAGEHHLVRTLLQYHFADDGYLPLRHAEKSSL